ncbi:unnamed protein product [Caenorhabditis auriculariae]|uniref:Uncharacterized protein n=1 Tax=Caenorhabditis auriculariae TaxID=2777116 RepID=A0A8S1H6K4_9PELO|nr:unnamed protein product [Caenorhabditis auriculariae]
MPDVLLKAISTMAFWKNSGSINTDNFVDLYAIYLVFFMESVPHMSHQSKDNLFEKIVDEAIFAFGDHPLRTTALGLLIEISSTRLENNLNMLALTQTKLITAVSKLYQKARQEDYGEMTESAFETVVFVFKNMSNNPQKVQANAVSSMTHLWQNDKIRENPAFQSVLLDFLDRLVFLLNEDYDQDCHRMKKFQLQLLLQYADRGEFISAVSEFRTLCSTLVRRILSEGGEQWIKRVLRSFCQSFYVVILGTPTEIGNDQWIGLERAAKALTALCKECDIWEDLIAKDLELQSLLLVSYNQLRLAIREHALKRDWDLAGKTLSMLSPLITILAKVRPEILKEMLKFLANVLSLCDDNSLISHLTAHMVNLATKYITTATSQEVKEMIAHVDPAWENLSAMQRSNIRAIYASFASFCDRPLRQELLLTVLRDVTSYLIQINTATDGMNVVKLLKDVLYFHEPSVEMVIERRKEFRAVFLSITSVLKSLRDDIETADMTFFLDPFVKIFLTTIKSFNALTPQEHEKYFHKKYQLPCGMSKPEKEALYAYESPEEISEKALGTVDKNPPHFFFAMCETFITILEVILKKFPEYIVQNDYLIDVIDACTAINVNEDVDFKFKRWTKSGWRLILLCMEQQSVKREFYSLFLDRTLKKLCPYLTSYWTFYLNGGLRVTEEDYVQEHLTVGLSRDLSMLLRNLVIAEEGVDPQSNCPVKKIGHCILNGSQELLGIVDTAMREVLSWPDTKVVNNVLLPYRVLMWRSWKLENWPYFQLQVSDLVMLCMSRHRGDEEFLKYQLQPVLVWALELNKDNSLILDVMRKLISCENDGFFDDLITKAEANAPNLSKAVARRVVSFFTRSIVKER